MINKNLLNVIFIVSMLIVTGLGIMMVVRNIPYGIAAVFIMAAINALAVVLLFAAANIKKKLWAVVCRIVVVAWFIYAAIGAFASANEDAPIFATIYVVAGVLAVVFGILRQKIQNK